jgi:hypothetical protein
MRSTTTRIPRAFRPSDFHLEGRIALSNVGPAPTPSPGMVLVDVQGTGNLNTFKASVTAAGMTITATDPQHEIVEGYVSSANLAKLQHASQVAHLTLVIKPMSGPPIFFH